MKQIRAALPILAVIIATWSLTTASAQPAAWRLVQGSDGVLFVIRGDIKHRIVPAAMTEVDMAIAEASAWEDGVMLVAPPDRAAGAPANPPSSPTSSGAASGKQIGDTTVLTTPSGLRLAITVNAVDDNVRPGRYDSAPTGRYVAVDWTIKNEGNTEVDLNRLHFKLQTADGFVIQRTGEVREPGLKTDTVGPGQIVRGWLTYDVPSGAKVVSAIYQPPGAQQFVIAELT